MEFQVDIALNIKFLNQVCLNVVKQKFSVRNVELLSIGNCSNINNMFQKSSELEFSNVQLVQILGQGVLESCHSGLQDSC